MHYFYSNDDIIPMVIESAIELYENTYNLVIFIFHIQAKKRKRVFHINNENEKLSFDFLLCIAEYQSELERYFHVN